jgi:hypothetical protein
LPKLAKPLGPLTLASLDLSPHTGRGAFHPR